MAPEPRLVIAQTPLKDAFHTSFFQRMQVMSLARRQDAPLALYSEAKEAASSSSVFLAIVALYIGPRWRISGLSCLITPLLNSRVPIMLPPDKVVESGKESTNGCSIPMPFCIRTIVADRVMAGATRAGIE
ncbi:hypothetical protein PENSUB_12320 [Penicillium subrubescens]|uniref:Uncharacterized protein n=1 Tax=Penicillium subrubescens TaxID=1316194 RepID=A0A1Q5SZ23_9EURO|nr:hypothetical protein PENSUB_12320 [Penicillium subrubescens]